MNRFRISLLLASAVVIGLCATSVLAKPRADATCCGGDGDCAASGEICCPAQILGLEPCSLDLTGFCRPKCTPGGGSD